MRSNFEQRANTSRLYITQCSFCAVLDRHDYTITQLVRLEGSRQYTGDGTQITVQCELSVELEFLKCVRRDQPARSEDAQRDSQIKSTAGLAHVSRPEVHGDTFLRKTETRADNGTANPVFAFANGRFRHADHRKHGQTT